MNQTILYICINLGTLLYIFIKVNMLIPYISIYTSYYTGVSCRLKSKQAQQTTQPHLRGSIKHRKPYHYYMIGSCIQNMHNLITGKCNLTWTSLLPHGISISLYKCSLLLPLFRSKKGSRAIWPRLQMFKILLN